MPSRAQCIGKMAEEQVKTWAAGAGIVATKPDEDRHGWDLFLELPQQDSGPGPTCFVQVKATDGERGGCAVRLDNWQRHIQSPWPCFFVVLEYAGRLEAQSLYVIHVGEAWIARVLERLRILRARGEAVGSRHSLKLIWGAAEMVRDRSGAGILGAIRRAVGPDPFVYVNEKRRLLESVGYGTDRYEGTITFSGSSDADMCQLLVDHAIGLTPLIEARRVTVKERRFGIALPADLPIHSLPMKISVIPAPEDVEVRFQSEDGKRVVQEACKMYRSAAAFPFLPRQYHKARIVSENVTLIMELSTHRMNVTVDLPDAVSEVTIGRAHRAASILRMLLEQPQQGLRIDLMMPFGSVVCGAGSMGIPSCNPGAMSRLSAIEECWQLMQKFGLRDSEVVSVQHVYDSAAAIHQMLLFLGEPQDKVQFWGTLNPRPGIKEGAVAVVFAAELELGRHKLAGVFVVRGTGRFGDNPMDKSSCRLEIANGRLTVHETVVVHRQTDLTQRLQRSIEMAGKELDAAPIDVVVLMPAGESAALDAQL